MKAIVFIALLLCGLAMEAHAGYSVTWDAVTQNVDGTPITDLAGYVLHACDGNNATDCPTRPACSTTVTTNCVIHFTSAMPETTFTPSDQSTPRTWYVTAKDTAGNESGPSNLAFYPPQTINVSPKAPLNLHINIQ